MILSLEQQVVSLPLAQKLKSLNCPQGSLFYYAGEEIWFRSEEDVCFSARGEYQVFDYIREGFGDFCAAHTASELGKLLKGEGALPSFLSGRFGDGWYGDKDLFDGKSEVNARAKMLIFLLEQKLITL